MNKIFARIDQDIYEKIEELAEKKGVSVRQMAKILVEDFVRDYEMGMVKQEVVDCS